MKRNVLHACRRIAAPVMALALGLGSFMSLGCSHERELRAVQMSVVHIHLPPFEPGPSTYGPAFGKTDEAQSRALQSFDQGLDAYRNGQYWRSQEELKRSAAGDALPEGERTQAWLYAAASAYWMGDSGQSSAILRQLYSHNPNAAPDPAVFPPEFCAFAEIIHDGLSN